MQEFPDVCAVIPARNESSTLANVYRQLHRAGVRNCVTVVNGSTDGTYETAQGGDAYFSRFSVLNFETALGYDVPRAVGAYSALRMLPKPGFILIVDGDWLGSFGPALCDFITHTKQTQVDAQYISYRTAPGPLEIQRAECRLDEQIWVGVLANVAPSLCGLAPSLAPAIFHTRLFNEISPEWLSHPGRWFAYALRSHVGKHIEIGLYRWWDTLLCGNRSRSAAHDHQMRTTLIGDALEGVSIIEGRKTGRSLKGVIYDGYHTSRRMDVLDQWQSKISVDPVVGTKMD